MGIRNLLVLGACLVCVAGSPAWAANWRLDEGASSLKFASVKNDTVAEVHHFTSLTGGVAGSQIEIRVQLASVETMIDVRDDRMREMLFEVVRFPEAIIRVDGSDLSLDDIASIGMRSLTVPMEVTVHGVTQTMTASTRVVSLGDRVVVINDAPLLVRAADFGLDAGVEALRQVAGLSAIDRVVPVTFTLVFEQVGAGVPQPPKL